MTTSGGLTLHPRCILTALPDGTGVVLHMQHKVYFTLNHTAVFVWDVLTKNPGATAPAVSSALAAHFEIPLAEATRDVDELLAQFSVDDLVVTAPASRE